MSSGPAMSLSYRILKNVAWNFVGQGWILLISLFAIPYMIQKLTVSLYGIYVLTSAIVGYFSFLELGFGAAGVKFIAQYLAEKNTQKARDVFWTCLCVYGVMGSLGAAVIVFSADYGVRHFFRVPAEYQGVSVTALKVAGIGFLIMMMSGVASAVLRAQSRFDLLNRVAIALMTLQLGASVFLLAKGYSLIEVLVAGLIVQGIGVFIYGAMAFTSLPFLTRPSWRPGMFGTLFRFGGFVTVSGVAAPILLNIEKLFLSTLRPVALLTYYSVPFSLMDRLSTIRSSVTSVLFPTFSSLEGLRKHEVSRELHDRSTAYIFFAYVFFVLFFIVFGKDFLALWLGERFAVESTKILIILMVAGLINALAAPAVVALQATGRPQWPALFHVIEAVAYVPLAFIFIKRWGGTGAALAWFVRVVADTLLLHCCACRMFKESCLVWYGRLIVRFFVPFTACLGGLLGLRWLHRGLLDPVNLTGIFFIFCGYAVLTWRYGLDGFARRRIAEFFRGAIKGR